MRVARMWPADVADHRRMHSRRTPLVLVASPNEEVAEQLLREVQRGGSTACRARSVGGCLRVATAIGPDIVLLDSSLPRGLRDLLRAHPATAPVVGYARHIVQARA
jgi:hypothetical protein